MSDSGMKKILERHKALTVGIPPVPNSLGYKIYSVSNLRGGIGKTSLAFNIAHELSRRSSLLLADVCPQCNLTELIFRSQRPQVKLTDALMPRIMGSAFGDEVDDISYIMSDKVETFKGGKNCYFIPGDPELFAFPSMLYQQLNNAFGRANPTAISNLLNSLKSVLLKQAALKKCDSILIDTSPFYAGGTHLAWTASDALIVPVRVDENSMYSFEMLLKMLTAKEKDFVAWNDRGGSLSSPKIASVVMTMVGASTSEPGLPDSASRVYVERALDIAERFPTLFPHEDPSDAFVLVDDFRGSGRISGALSIPLTQLVIGEFKRVDRRRLQVNKAIGRYQNQVRFIAAML
jgi:chromosome partitioning protein